MKQRSWLAILLSFAGPCRGKLVLSVICAIISVAGGFVPYLGVYEILRLFIHQSASGTELLRWAGVCLAGYAVKVAFYAFSTMLAHVSAYTILEGLRRQVAHKLMHAPLGSVLSKPVGSLKSTIVDRIEDIEPPLAHMIPELSSNVLLPIVVVISLFAMDWRVGLASLATIPAALIPMAAGLRTYNEKYAAYMAANAQVNSIIVEYVEGIEVVKAFNQSGASYEKFVRAVTSFRDFTLDWFRCTWKSMNLCLSILPTTLLATLPVGIALYQTGVLDPSRLALCLMLVLGIVSPLVQAVAFLNSMKSMEFAVRDTRHLLDLEELPEASEPARLSGSGITLRDVSFSYSGKEEDTVLRHIDLELPAGTFTALVGPSGGGKSTAARLIARFWDVTDGRIAIEDILDSVAHHIELQADAGYLVVVRGKRNFGGQSAGHRGLQHFRVVTAGIEGAQVLFKVSFPLGAVSVRIDGGAQIVQLHFSAVSDVDAIDPHRGIQQKKGNEHHYADHKKAGEESDFTPFVAEWPSQPPHKMLHRPPHFQ